MTSNPITETVGVGDPSKSLGPDGQQRQEWIDNTRTATILLVINMHCCVTYSYVGDWYLKDGPEGSLVEKLPYIFWIFHLQSFFMGLLFFLAGIFAHGALSRRGSAAFLGERVFRLGAPALMYMVFLQPLIVYGLLGARPQEVTATWVSVYMDHFTTGQVLSGSGPMWFVLALLLFSAVLAIWRGLFANERPARRHHAPRARTLLAFALALALLTAIARCLFPLGTSIFNFQLGYFLQYIAAFAVGVAAGKGGWLHELVMSRRAKMAGYMALIGGPLLLGLVLWLGGAPSEGPAPGEHGPILYFGGWNAQAFGAALWEQLTGVGLALGMMAWFSRNFTQDGAAWRWMADRSFAAYVFHPPIVVSLTLLFRTIPVGQLAHIVLLTVAGLALSFTVADVAKRIPGFRKLF